MKSILIKTNIEKANLLISLHPEERKNLITFFEQSAKNLIDHQKEYRKTWDNGFVEFDWWLELASQVLKAIQKNRVKIENNTTVFANDLFVDMNAIFCNDCIIKYAKENMQNSKFNLMVAALLCTPQMYNFSFR